MPIQFFNFSILNLIQLFFFSTVPSIRANLSVVVLLHSAVRLSLEIIMFTLKIKNFNYAFKVEENL
jgi:hypothetical protein